MTMCPALFIAAPASGQGKTTVTAALAWHWRHSGKTVRVFKTGPDFLDPMILERASGSPVYQLDLWMGGEPHCRQLLYDAALAADVLLIEGVMGLFDGEPSSADLAAMFGIPILAVIDASAMAQTFGALVHGLANYHPNLPFAGVIANRVAGERHYEMLAESLPAGIPCLGWVERNSELTLPERHLGLTQASEIEDLDERLAFASRALNAWNGSLPAPVHFSSTERVEPVSPKLRGVTIAIARDAAFGFLYRANLDCLRALGAELVYFSPMRDVSLPHADALYFPGGYPELHLNALGGNASMKESVRAHFAADKPIVAECGGMLYLLDALTDIYGSRVEMVGLLPGEATMRQKLASLGLHSIELPEGQIRGHTFHYSSVESAAKPIVWSKGQRDGRRGEAVYRVGRLHASYIHLYFSSNPQAVAQLFMPNF